MKHATLILTLILLSPLGFGRTAHVLAQRKLPADNDKIRVIKNLAYSKSEIPRQRLDLYLPKTGKAKPVLVWIHGGGWRAGSKESGAPGMSQFLEKGFAIACINYRLSTDAIFPAQIQDCKQAIGWLKAHAEEYELAVDRFGVFGSSAGGHLAALVGTTGGDDTFVGPGQDASVSTVNAVCDFYGPTDLEKFVATPGFESHRGDNAPESLLLGGPVEEKRDLARQANPIRHIDPQDPPFLIIHGTDDRTVPWNQSQLLFAALKEKGVPVHLHEIKGAGHGGPAFSDPAITKMVVDFFESRLNHTGQDQEEKAQKTSSEAAVRESMRPAGRTFQSLVNRLDRDGDGRLSRSEVPAAFQPARRFQQLDLNGDGKLEESEFKRFQELRSRQEDQQRSGDSSESSARNCDGNP